MPPVSRFVAGRGDTVARTLVVPTARDFVKSECIKVGMTVDSTSAYVIGRIVREDGTPVADAPWEMWASDERGRIALEKPGGRTGSDGVFQYCGAGLGERSEVTVQSRVSGRDPWFSATVDVHSLLTTMTVVVRPRA